MHQFKRLSHGFFSAISVMHHYLSMSKKYIEACQGEEIKLKRYFYALRTTVAARWIREKQMMPPTDFILMLKELDHEVRELIQSLIDLKAGKGEGYVHQQESKILHFLESETSLNEQAANSLPSARGNIKGLDELFRKTVKSVS